MTTFISHHLCLEANCTLVPASAKNTITREDDKITVTFERALNYLKQALNVYEIASFYKKYFVQIIFEAEIEVLKKNESNIDVINNFINNLANQLFQEINDITPSTDVKFNNFEEIMNLSLQCMTLDKKSGELYLVLENRYIPSPIDQEKFINNSTEKLNKWDDFDWAKWEYYQNHHRYFLVNINISEEPSIADWKIIAKDLKTIPHEYDRDFWHDEWVYAAMTSKNEFILNNILEEVIFTQEINSTAYYKDAGKSSRAPEPADYKYLERKYLIIKRKDGSELYFKSPLEKVPPLIPDNKNNFPNLLPPNTKKTTPGCYFIEKESFMEYLTLPQSKSARSSIDTQL